MTGHPHRGSKHATSKIVSPNSSWLSGKTSDTLGIDWNDTFLIMLCWAMPCALTYEIAAVRHADEDRHAMFEMPDGDPCGTQILPVVPAASDSD